MRSAAPAFPWMRYSADRATARHFDKRGHEARGRQSLPEVGRQVERQENEGVQVMDERKKNKLKLVGANVEPDIEVAKNPGGRPKKQINWEEFDKLCFMQGTLAEIAGFFGVSEDTIERSCKFCGLL